MKTVLTENWIFDEAKYLFPTEKFHFVEKPKLFQFLLQGQISAVSLVHPLSPIKGRSEAPTGMRSHPGLSGLEPVTPVEVTTFVSPTVTTPGL